MFIKFVLLSKTNKDKFTQICPPSPLNHLIHICACAMPRTKTRSAKGFICKEDYCALPLQELLFYVGVPCCLRRASSVRGYRYTFHPSGFYQTLRREVARVLRPVGTGPDWRSKAIQDGLTGTSIFGHCSVSKFF